MNPNNGIIYHANGNGLPNGNARLPQVEVNRCQTCHMTFRSVASLISHAVDCARGTLCRFCGAVFKTSAQMKKHQEIHEQVVCRWCGKYCGNTGQLKSHERIHGEQGGLDKCPGCAKVFSRPREFIHHLTMNPTHRQKKEGE